MSRRSLCLLAAVLAANPVAAQPDAGTVRITHRLATCLVRTQENRATAYVARGTPSADSPAYERFLDTRCLPAAGAPPLDPRLVRGAIYEAMYARDFPQGGPANFNGVPPLAPPDGGADPALDAALLRFGECVARAAPADSRALLAAAPGSPEENGSITMLTPRLSPCIQNGLTVTFSAPILRGVIAEALYKLSRAVPAQSR